MFERYQIVCVLAIPAFQRPRRRSPAMPSSKLDITGDSRVTTCRNAPIDFEPDRTLVKWRIYQATTQERYFAGHCVETGRPEFTDPLVLFDRSSLKALSASGKVYRLEGAPGSEVADADRWELEAWIHDIEAAYDVTDTALSGRR